ncbi:MAG: Gfo/Idh/MocA family oxidoreductase [Bacteroidia bacterium]|nr:Gfo/Idh/MocA family oxidoreductase [Bacteroidia bacterium]
MNQSVALLGVGRWGAKLLRLLVERQAVRWVWTRSLEKHADLQSLYPELIWTSQIEDLWREPACKAVVIATPASTHPSLIEEALQAGKDVFCEKPLAFSSQQLQHLIEIAETKKQLLMGGHVLHYHPAIQSLRRLLQQGTLGKLLSFRAERASLGRFPLAEDALWGLAIHDIALLFYLIGEAPIQSHIQAQISLSHEAESVWIYLQYKSGIKGDIFASWLYPERKRKLTLIGTEGMVVFSEEGTQPTLLLYRHRIQWERGQHPLLLPAEGAEPIPFPAEEPLAKEIDHFLECLSTRQEPLTSARSLLAATALAERLHRQLKPEPQSILPYFVHPTAIVDEEVEIGEGTRVWHFSHILKGSRIGKNCVLGQNVVVGPYVKVGNNCKIQNNVSLYYGVELEDGVLCGPSCVFTNDKYPRAFIERRNEFLQTRVRRGATIGANATIMCGITIGRFAMVGAGAVVLYDVPDYALVVGNPARQVGWVCECGETLQEVSPDHLYYCSRCDLSYQRTLKGLEKVSS